MGCGTWGGNNFSDNMNYRHFLNITRIARPIPERVPADDEIFGALFRQARQMRAPRTLRERARGAPRAPAGSRRS